MFFLKQCVKDLSAAIYPELCAACLKRLDSNEVILCLHCLVNLPETNFHEDRENPVAKLFWGRVKLDFAAAFLYFSVKGGVQKLIHKLKYDGKYDVGVLLGKLYGYKLLKVQPNYGFDIIIPVPLHPDKIKKRGYNQSEAIALGLSEAMSIPANSTNFIRKVHTETQTKKSKYRRWENVDSIFDVLDENLFIDKHVLIVDDVITTGATIEACSHELLKIKGCRTSVVSIATAMRI